MIYKNTCHIRLMKSQTNEDLTTNHIILAYTNEDKCFKFSNQHILLGIKRQQTHHLAELIYIFVHSTLNTDKQNLRICICSLFFYKIFVLIYQHQITNTNVDIIYVINNSQFTMTYKRKSILNIYSAMFQYQQIMHA